MFIFIGLMIILIYLDNRKNDVDNKIANIDRLDNEIIVLKDNYDNLKEIDKKIKEVTNITLVGYTFKIHDGMYPN